jgi:DNA-binding beta-propeller fold protein YncE
MLFTMYCLFISSAIHTFVAEMLNKFCLLLLPFFTIIMLFYYYNTHVNIWAYPVDIKDIEHKKISQISHLIPDDVYMYTISGGLSGNIETIVRDPYSADHQLVSTDTGISTRYQYPAVAFNPRYNYLYVGHTGENYITVYDRHLSFVTKIDIDDTDCEVDEIPEGDPQCDGPDQLFYDPVTQDIYVISDLIDESTIDDEPDFSVTYVKTRIQVIDSETNTLIQSAQLEKTEPIPRIHSIDPYNGNLYYYFVDPDPYGNLDNNGIYTIHMNDEQLGYDYGQITGPIIVGDPTQASGKMAYDPYDLDPNHNVFYMLKRGEYKIVPRPDLNHCYFDNAWCNSLQAEQHCNGGSVNVVDISANMEIPIANDLIDCPTDIAFTPRGEIFITEDKGELGVNTSCPPEDGTVYILNKNLDIIDFVKVAPCPNKISYNPLDGNMYVYNANATGTRYYEHNAMSIISTVNPYLESLDTSLVDNSNGQTFADNALVPYGTKIRQGATIFLSWDPKEVSYYLPPTPLGTIKYYRASGSCDDAAFNVARGVPVTIDPNNAYYTLSPISALVDYKKMSYIAKYEGNYDRIFSSCKTINITPPQINTVIRDKDGKDVTGLTLPVGTKIRDTAIISLPDGSPPDTLPTGTVTYRRYNSMNCDEDQGFVDEPPVDISNGQVPSSLEFTSLTPSEVSYEAFFNGWSKSPCEKGTNFR